MRTRPVRLALIALWALILLSIVSASAARVDPPGALTVDEITQPITPNDLAPPECAALDLDALYVIGQGSQPAGNLLVIGGPGREVFLAGAGTDNCVLMGGGNDVVFGSTGSDVILSGPGNDWLFGGDGDDALYGGPGNDRLYGGNGDDALYGDGGNDICNGGTGNDTIDATCER